MTVDEKNDTVTTKKIRLFDLDIRFTAQPQREPYI